MKRKILPAIFLFFLFICNRAIAAETEPNNTKAQANTLTLNGNNSGAIGTSTDVDWWTVTTTGDGKLDVTITVSNNKYLRCDIYDNDGTTLLKSDYSNVSKTVSEDGLAAGTYYIKLYPFNAGDMPIYTISDALTVPAQANDAEPNGTKATAKVLPLNGSKTGHIDYYYNHLRDSADWYKVTTNADGRLRITMSSANGQYVWAHLYDNNGITLLEEAYTNGTAVLVNKDGLAAGTYYIKVNTFYNDGWAPYTISDSLFTPAIPNDTEPDSTKEQALTLPLNSSVNGHIDYYYNNHRDSVDWYKLTTNADGRIRLTITSANGQNVWAYLFDNDGTTALAQGYTNGNAVVVNKDGLAAGTYYIRVNTYYTYEWAPYTLADSLFTPSIPNDTEPDSTKAQALVLPLNGKKNGHINYYYNNHKDSVDWYKLTTNADGRIRLTITSANNQNVWAYLFDNDGTTALAQGYTNGNAVVVNKDGLAAGTYYIRVNTYYTNEWAPYTLADSLFKPAQANDEEPNNSRGTAITLPLNGSETGHVNYYYKNKKDSADWYKLTAGEDGMITINIQSHNAQNVWAYLFDNDGTTLLNSAYTTSSASYTYDGLKAGVYYIRVNTYYNNEWAPYTLSNTLSVYANKDDSSNEPNNSFKQAKTISSNATKTGHTGFYYDGITDAVDYHKINYTGTGNLTIQFNQENRFKYGGPVPTWFQVYKDTAAAPISSGYYYTSSGDINFTGLTQGYYYLKIITYYTGKGEHFSSYSIKNTFKQVNIAKIGLGAYDSTGSCSGNNSITYLLTKSHSPYKVQLYRFGAPYGDPVFTTKKTVTFDSLPSGSYYATVYGDGATGNAFSQSKTVTIEPITAGLTTTNIRSQQARLNWDAVECAAYFTIQYKEHSASVWKKKTTKGNVTSYVLKNLTPNTQYDWRIAVTDSANGVTTTGLYSNSISFTTPASLIAGSSDAEEDLSINQGKNPAAIFIAPNPAISYFTIHHNIAGKDKILAVLYNENGKSVWTSGIISAEALNGKKVSTNQFANGLYYLKLTDTQGIPVATIKVSILK